MGKRRQAREVALKLLYALECTQAEVDTVLATSWTIAAESEEMEDAELHEMSRGARAFTAALVSGVMAQRDDIDALIQAASLHWSLERIGLVERNLLRFAIYELLYMADIPPKVTINEAVEIAKRYGAADASVFINGILDRITHDVVPQSAEELSALSGHVSSPSH